VPLPGAASACPEAALQEVYVMRGDCGHDLGRVGPGTLDAPTGFAALAAGELTPLTFTAEGPVLGGDGVPVHTTQVTSFVFRGGGHQKSGDQTTAGRCHHCRTPLSCRTAAASPSGQRW